MEIKENKLHLQSTVEASALNNSIDIHLCLVFEKLKESERKKKKKKSKH